LPEIDLETGHTLVHYLYTGTYEALNDSTPSLGLKHALSVYMAAMKAGPDSLHLLAIREFQAHAEKLNIFEIFDAIKADFKDLASLESDGWIHGFMRKKTQEAFEHDHRVFKNEALLKTLDNVTLAKVVMTWVIEMYDDKVSRMIKEEEKVRASSKEMLEEQMLVTPVVDECCTQQVSEHGSEHGSIETEGFCTISCPSEEGAYREDGVVVDEGNLSGSVELLSHDLGETEAVPEEATHEETGHHDAIAANPQPEPMEEESAVDPFARLSKSQKKKLQDKMLREARLKREGNEMREEKEQMHRRAELAEEVPCEEVEEFFQQTNEEVVELEAMTEARYREMNETNLRVEAEATAAAPAAELEPAVAEEEPVIEPSARRKIGKKETSVEKRVRLRMESREAEKKAAKLARQQEAEVERVRQEEARNREEINAAAEAAEAEEAKLREDAEPKVCPLRARHMINEKRWMKCASCRAAVQHIAARLSRTNVDEETLQDLEKELVI
jgi:hypothetical protein